MKKCAKCGIEKELSEFGMDKSRPDGLNVYCKTCSKQKANGYYHTNTEYCLRKRSKQNEYNKRYMVGYRERVKTYIQSQIQPCAKCGEDRKYVIDFHHIDPSKKLFTVQSGNRRSEEAIHEEIKKCVCLCGNCHAEFHHLYGLHPKQPVEALREYLGGNSE